jgi:hypothetical protein
MIHVKGGVNVDQERFLYKRWMTMAEAAPPCRVDRTGVSNAGFRLRVRSQTYPVTDTGNTNLALLQSVSKSNDDPASGRSDGLYVLRSVISPKSCSTSQLVIDSRVR